MEVNQKIGQAVKILALWLSYLKCSVSKKQKRTAILTGYCLVSSNPWRPG